MSRAPGDRLGPYEIVAAIGAGGMGEVYRARDTKLNRDVAIKLLPDSFANDAERLARFTREAQTLASLNHPNIAIIHGLDESNGVRALVMELVEGEDLSQRIARGALPLDETLPIARQIAKALEAAHEQGIVHRDLKPANIKVRADGTVKVLDFGLAKALEQAGSASANVSQSPTITTPALATHAGVILGTAAYMSPEQARGKPVDKRSDIWAYGCLLFEMLTGRRAFDGDDVTEVLAFIITKEVNWALLPTATPQAIRRLLRRCLEKDRTRRLPDIGVASLDIDEGLGAPNDVAPAARSSRSAWLVSGLVAVLLLVAVAVWSYARISRPEGAETVRFSLDPPLGTMFSPLEQNLDHRFAISPDGRLLVMSAVAVGAADPKPQLWIRPINALQARPLPGTDGARSPFWSPDSRSVAFFANGQLKRVDVIGGSVFTITAARVGNNGSWGSRGTIIFYPNGNSPPLHKVSAAGGVSVPIGPSDDHNELGAFFLPDGEHYLFRRASTSPGTRGPAGGEIYLASLGSTERHVLLQADSQALIANGRLLFARGNALMAQPFDVNTYKLSGEAVPVTDSLWLSPGGFGAFSASNTGVLGYQSASESLSQLKWIDRSGKMTGTVGEPALYSNPRLSPDGKKLAVCILDLQARTRDVWIMDLIRHTRIRFTVDRGDDLLPQWSPDGEAIIFTSDRLGSRDLYLKATSGVAEEQLVLKSTAQKNVTDWSSDGKFVLFHAALNAGISIMDPRNPASARQWKPTSSTEQNGQFSPDGRWVSFESSETGRKELYVAPASGSGGGRQIVSSNGGSQSRWRRDGKELFYVSGASLMAVDVAIDGGSALEFGSTHELFRINSGASAVGVPYDVSADGRSFLINSSLGDDKSSVAIVLNWTAELNK